MTTALPPPTGPFAVGRTVREWTDRSRTDPYAADPSEPRSLLAWIWLADPGSGDMFAGRLDLGRLAAVGHSFGGAAALQWCRDDPRCTAAVNLDRALWTEVGQAGLSRPVLQILAPHPEFDLTPGDAVAAGIAPDPEWYAAERAITLDGWATVDRTAQPAHTVRIAGATHLSFMDIPFLPLAPQSPARPMFARTTIEPGRMLTVTNTLLVAFLTGADVVAVLASEEVGTAPRR